MFPTPAVFFTCLFYLLSPSLLSFLFSSNNDLPLTGLPGKLVCILSIPSVASVCCLESKDSLWVSSSFHSLFHSLEEKEGDNTMNT